MAKDPGPTASEESDSRLAPDPFAAVLPAIAAVGFLRTPTAKAAKGVEAAAGLSLLVSYVLVIAALAVTRGVTWV